LSTLAANRRGIIAMLAAMTFFVFSDTVLKLATAGFPPGQIMAVRGVFAVLITLGIITATGQLRQLPGILSPLVLTRAALEAGVSFLFITSLAVLPLANITAILQSTPIIITLIVVVLGMEQVGWRRWGAVIVGFVGVLLIVRPSPAGFDIYALIALITAALIAGRDFVTRGIGDHVPSIVITFSTTAAVMLAGLLAGLGETWPPLGLYEMGLLFAAALLVTVGNFAIIVAFRGTDVSVVSPFRYSNVPMAIVLGLLVFSELPDLISFAGIALIVLSGIYTIHREQLRRPAAGAAFSPADSTHPA
jgi:drug/metabolite transporter (DMT)-like permease